MQSAEQKRSIKFSSGQADSTSTDQSEPIEPNVAKALEIKRKIKTSDSSQIGQLFVEIAELPVYGQSSLIRDIVLRWADDPSVVISSLMPLGDGIAREQAIVEILKNCSLNGLEIALGSPELRVHEESIIEHLQNRCREFKASEVQGLLQSLNFIPKDTKDALLGRSLARDPNDSLISGLSIVGKKGYLSELVSVDPRGVFNYVNKEPKKEFASALLAAVQRLASDQQKASFFFYDSITDPTLQRECVKQDLGSAYLKNSLQASKLVDEKMSSFNSLRSYGPETLSMLLLSDGDKESARAWASKISDPAKCKLMLEKISRTN